MPIGVHAVVPTGRWRKVTSAKALPGIAAPISARPPTTPPAAGAAGWTVIADSGAWKAVLARNTWTDSGGTVTVTRPARSEVTPLDVPSRGRKLVLGDAVANVAVFASVALFATTTYSRRAALSIRLTA